MRDNRLDGDGLMDDIAEVLITAEELQTRVTELGTQTHRPDSETAKGSDRLVVDWGRVKCNSINKC